ncbi:5324_t:CDS:1, partial [Racocetra fulgida]
IKAVCNLDDNNNKYPINSQINCTNEMVLVNDNSEDIIEQNSEDIAEQQHTRLYQVLNE